MTIKTRTIADGAVTSAKLATSAITNAAFVAGAITAGKMNADAAGAAPLGNSSGLHVHRVARVTFDPTAVVGDRAAGAHAASFSIPAGAILAGGFIAVITTFTSATDAATIAFSIVSADDIVVAIAISDGTNPWDAGAHAIILKANTPEHATAGIKLAAAAALTFTVAGGETLTGGKLVAFVDYTVSSVT